MRSTIAGLGAAPRLLLHVLCALDPDDRRGDVLPQVWAQVWEARGYGGDPEAAGRAARDTLFAAGLLIPPEPGRVPDEVTAAVDERADRELRHASWAVAADQWCRTVREALPGPGRDEEAGQVVGEAAPRAARYLMRLGAWRDATGLLGLVINRDESPATAARLLPVIEELVAGSRGTGAWIGAQFLFNCVYGALAPEKVVPQWEALLRDALRSGSADEIVSARSSLALALQRVGQLSEALRVADEALAGDCPDPMSRLFLELRRLQALLRMGRPGQVVDRADELLRRLDVAWSRSDRTAYWDAEETILSLAGTAALQCERWEQALDFQTREVASKTRRGATALAVAQATLNTCGPLIRLGRLGEAARLIAECDPVLRRDGGPSWLAQGYGVQADLAYCRGDAGRAAELAVVALRHAYRIRAADVALLIHLNLSLYRRAAGDPGGALADGLAAVLIAAATGADFHGRTINTIAAVLSVAHARLRNGPDRYSALRDDLAVRTELSLDTVVTGLPADRAEALIETALAEAARSAPAGRAA